MPTVRITFNEETYQKVCDMAKEEGISVQDLIRNKVLGEETTIFTPAKAVERVFEKYNIGDTFTIPELYGEDWATMRRGVAGVFGKQFYNYVANECPEKIKFDKMVNSYRHAQYIVLSK